MTIDVDHLLAMGVVVRVGGADAVAATRRLLGIGVRIGTEQQRAKRSNCRVPCPSCGGHHDGVSRDAA